MTVGDSFYAIFEFVQCLAVIELCFTNEFALAFVSGCELLVKNITKKSNFEPRKTAYF